MSSLKDTMVGNVDIISRMFDSVEKDDMESFKSCFEEDATIWLNIDQVDRGVVDSSEHLKGVVAGSDYFNYRDRKFYNDGNSSFVQYTVLVSPKGGREIRIPAIARVEFSSGGKIARLEEYFDSAALRGSH